MSNKKKVIIIGIDSLDSVLLEKFESSLPNFKKLRERMPPLNYTSVFPPDSITAWASIYTGCNPAKHGRVYFIAVDKINEAQYTEIDNNDFHGTTFWDIAGRFGKKVCVLFPYIGYPPWKVNGLMIAKAITKDEIKSYPSFLKHDYDLLNIKRLSGVPTYFQLKHYISKAKNVILNETIFGLNVFKDYQPDLFFLFSGALDFIEHNFWGFYDKNDPTYPGPNPYDKVFEQFYKLYDNMVGKFLELLDSKTELILLSDHGHGMRPVKLFNVNEFLRRKGLLISKIKNNHFSDPYFVMEKIKSSATCFIDKFSKYGVGNLAISTLHYFTAGRKLYKTPLYINWQKTVAHLADLSGVKAYSYGGIVIRSDKIDQRYYEKLRTAIIEELRSLKSPTSDKLLFKLVCRREEMYMGDHIVKFPDILFELTDEYGAGWDVNASLFSKTYSHKLHVGTHKRDTGVFLVSAPNRIKNSIKEITCMDVAPTILHILGIEDTNLFDGNCIIENCQKID